MKVYLEKNMVMKKKSVPIRMEEMLKWFKDIQQQQHNAGSHWLRRFSVIIN